MLCHAKLCLARPLPTRYITVTYLTNILRPHQYLIINYTTFYISFHSPGITTMLYPTKPRAQPVLQTHNTHTLSKSRSSPHPHHNSGLGPGPATGPGSSADLAGQIVGMDIFRFLATHSTASKLGSDFKARVRTALSTATPSVWTSCSARADTWGLRSSCRIGRR
jgi:hypothetical protein